MFARWILGGVLKDGSSLPRVWWSGGPTHLQALTNGRAVSQQNLRLGCFVSRRAKPASAAMRSFSGRTSRVRNAHLNQPSGRRARLGRGRDRKMRGRRTRRRGLAVEVH